MFRYLREDIRAVFDRDPAARSSWEVLTCYPGIHALIMHRLAHWLWGHRLRWLARRMAASVYFAQVTSPSSQRVEPTGQNGPGEAAYYKFTLSGKVFY